MPKSITKALTEKLLDEIHDAVVAVDRKGKIVLYNESAEKLFGIPKKNAILRDVWDVVIPSNLSRIIMDSVKFSEAKPMETTVVFPDDRIFSMRIVPARDDSNKIFASYAIFEDITTHHKLEKVINDYLTTILRELSTPATIIKGYCETLLDGAMEEKIVTKKFLQVINEETNKLIKIIVNLQQTTKKAQTETDKTEIEAINVETVINEAVDMIRGLLDEKRINIELIIAKGLMPVKIKGDALKQIIINLLDNAIKFTSLIKGQGKISVNATLKDNEIEISVADNGIGIKEEYHDKIFEHFYKVVDDKTSELGGAGLGLFICKELITNNGGHIRVESKLSRGSKFILTIPAK